MSKRGQEPAYPVPEIEDRTGDLIPAQLQGISVRLRIASEQMAGMWSNPSMSDDLNIPGMAHYALKAADALLAAEEETR